MASAFYDVAWVREDASAQTYTEAMDHLYDDGAKDVFVLSWRAAGGMVAELRNRGESYMDWAVEAESGVISERIRALMAALGLRPVL